MLSPPVYTYLQEKKKDGLPPDFLLSLVASANLMRLSLLKAARAVMSVSTNQTANFDNGNVIVVAFILCANRPRVVEI